MLVSLSGEREAGGDMKKKCIDLAEIRAIRAVLGKSQREMAQLLGISIRAVQSYEQGWRPVPPTVQRLAGVLLMTIRRHGRPAGAPCWKVRDCPPVDRADCFAYEIRAGELCWALTGTRCGEKDHPQWEKKIHHCMDCSVMSRWLYA